MAETTIEWCRYTFNPWRGCTKIAPECENCYAADFAKRNPKLLGEWGAKGTRVVAAESQWSEPLKWDREAAEEPFVCRNCGQRYFCGSGGTAKCDWKCDIVPYRPRVFCASFADLFDDWSGPLVDHAGRKLYVSPGTGKWLTNDFESMRRDLTMLDVLRRVIRVVDATPFLDWLFLTKRPERILPTWNAIDERPAGVPQRFRKNVWLGTSAGTQATADRFVPELLKCRDLARRLFVSAEPLLESVDFTPWVNRGIDLIIAGGESGKKSRIYRPEWPRRILRDTRGTGTKFFHKQCGAFVVDRNDMIGAELLGDEGWPDDTNVEHDIHGFRENYQGADCRIRLKDKKGGNPAEWPADLRVRELPV